MTWSFVAVLIVNGFRRIFDDSVSGIVDIVSNVLNHCDPFE